jgi:hypothetical protein
MFRSIDHHQGILYKTQNKDSEFCKDGLMMVHRPKYIVKTWENKNTYILLCLTSETILFSLRVIRIITGCGNRNSHKNLFKILNILPPIAQYIISVPIFVVKNKDQFFINSEIHYIYILDIVLTFTYLQQIWILM